MNSIIKFFLENRLITFLLLGLLILWGVSTAPFDFTSKKLKWFPRDPVAVDAIPDIGENQQIVFTSWPGRSPQDIDDQVTYPLTTYLLGIPGVKTIRSNSMFGFSSIYIIFNEDIEFYWSRSRILEKLGAIPAGLLPANVMPSLGPDATALGQIFWYTLEGYDEEGNPTGGWDLQELRSIQDFHVKYMLSAAEGVSEVASIGGYVKEYQVDINPGAIKAHGVQINEIIMAIRSSNKDVGAKTIEINRAEYMVRGLGYINNIADLEMAVVKVNNNIPLRLRDVATITVGPAERRGVLDKGGYEAVGGVVVARYGSNPLEVIKHVKNKIEEINPGMPEKALEDGRISKIKIVPFYDRTQLINETLGTLEEALNLEILITILVIIILVANLRASLVITSLLPIAVLMVFLAMRYIGIDANIVALSGIAIAIGTMVDIGIVITENIIKHLEEDQGKSRQLDVIFKATAEVSGAVLTSVLTTIVSFIPVFFLQAAEGKLFHPLAYTKTFALVASLLVALVFLPAMSSIILKQRKSYTIILNALLIVLGIYTTASYAVLPGILIMATGAWYITKSIYNLRVSWGHWIDWILAGVVILFLTISWTPLGASKSEIYNFIFVAFISLGVLILFRLIIRYYSTLLQVFLNYKKSFLALPAALILLSLIIWLGFDRVFGWAAHGFDKLGINVKTSSAWSGMVHAFPGVGAEFMPSLDEGSFLLMPTSMPHAGIEENKRVLQLLDLSVQQIPEIELVVGKAGRVESALDPAPISMFENVINYKSEYMLDEKGYRKRFKTNREGEFLLAKGGSISHEEALSAGVAAGDLIPDLKGDYFRQWRDQIKSTDDIWNEIVQNTKFPGITSAPKLQPIETRLVMLQTGMRAPMGIKVKGPDLTTIETFGIQLEEALKGVPAIKTETVFAERIVGKPYLLIDIDRQEIARYGLTIDDVQMVIETSIGGMPLSQTVEGRERYAVRLRYPRELRDRPEEIEKVLVSSSSGIAIPLGDLAMIRYEKGPQMIKSEDTYLVGYVIFDKSDGYSEVETVNQARTHINEMINNGSLKIPQGVSFTFTGNYENQVRASNRLSVIIPVALVIIFLILYMQFRSTTTTFIVFTGIAVAFSGGFLMIWLYGTDWFMDFSLFGANMRDIFQVKTLNLSVAVWVGFIALFGIATDDGVVMATYLHQGTDASKLRSVDDIRNMVIEAGIRRIRPCLMTTATTLLALMPILSSTGKGSDIMVPMAIPAFGGMTIELITLFVVPVLYSWKMEFQLKRESK